MLRLVKSGKQWQNRESMQVVLTQEIRIPSATGNEVFDVIIESNRASNLSAIVQKCAQLVDRK